MKVSNRDVEAAIGNGMNPDVALHVWGTIIDDEKCSATIRILDDRWGGITDTCELATDHDGDHEIAYDACIPPARLTWPNPDAPQPLA